MEDNFNDTPENEQPVDEKEAEEQTDMEESAEEQPAGEEQAEEQSEHAQSIYQDPNADVTVENPTVQDQRTYTPPQDYQQSYSQNPDPNTDLSPLSLGDSLILVILFAIPCVNLIVALVWAFGGTKNVNRRNLSRAQLIVWAAVLLLSILFYVVFAATIYNGLTG